MLNRIIVILLIVFSVAGCGIDEIYARELIDRNGNNVIIDMHKIAMIESRNGQDKRHINTGGVYQIEKICLADYNAFHKQKITYSQLNEREYSYKVAYWYLNVRIPQLLKHYRLPVTVDNVIIAYNAGIGNAIKGRIPPVTKTYLDKYSNMKKYYPTWKGN